ncbi:MAG: glycogen synthase GlgA [Candidatus Binatia bacterium]
MKVFVVSSELFPLAKTGGLADAVGALARTLVRVGNEVAVVMPAYQTVLKNGFQLEETGIPVEVSIASRRVSGTILRTWLGKNLPVYLIRADPYFLRDGLYGNSQGDYPDNAERFTFFSKAALELARKTAPWNVIHCHDWQTALIPVLKKIRAHSYPEIQKSKILLTIHNLAYQGNFPASAWSVLNLDMRYFTPRYLEFYSNINFLKGGILFSDAFTTVSKKHAIEIKTTEYGCGLDGVIRDRERDLYGILNGVDYKEWNPATDPHIKKNYETQDLDGKKSCKKELQEIYNLPPEPSVPLIGMVSRLVDQKGLDILLEAMEDLLRLDRQFVVLGTGEERYEKLLAGLCQSHPLRLGVKIGFDNTLAHKIEAGADMFLMPSKFEPCGLNQIYSLKYGTIPIVRATGGLDDTIEDHNPLTGTGNGFKFTAYSGPALLEAVNRATTLYSNTEAWHQLMANAMAYDFSWERSAIEYFALYLKLLKTPSHTLR